jgi:uncharacterized protein YcbK (DUF882 family)
MRLTRRRFALQSAAAFGLASLAARAHADDGMQLELRNTHTGESLAAPLCGPDGLPDLDCYARFDHLLRDHRNGEARPIDRLLFAQLLALPRVLGVAARYEVISGYRSPQSNEALRAAGRGVVRHSLHLEGRAIDVRLLGVDCAQLRDAALAAAQGGVGYYARSNFVHLDTGRVRTWAD